MSRKLLLPLIVCLCAGCDLAKNGPPSGPTPISAIQEVPGVPAGGSYPSNGPAVIAYVAARYPERLAAGVSGDERLANVRFLRDRIIETGKCGGMDLGWNLKRGGPEVSVDFIVDRSNGDEHGIDIAFDYDNTGQPVRLQWVGGDAPFYSAYPETACH